MVTLNETKNGIWNDDRPEIIAENPVNNKEDAPNKIYNPNFFNVFQNKTQYNKKRSGITNQISDIRAHRYNFLGTQT